MPGDQEGGLGDAQSMLQEAVPILSGVSPSAGQLPSSDLMRVTVNPGGSVRGGELGPD